MKNLESKKYVNSELLTLTCLGWALSQCGQPGYSPESPFLMLKSVKIVHILKASKFQKNVKYRLAPDPKADQTYLTIINSI
jgi:hypothetical protein